MSQPQPTAALTDAELIDSIEMDTGLSAGTIRDVLAALPQAGYRLARAESAPGVTIPVEDATEIQVLVWQTYNTYQRLDMHHYEQKWEAIGNRIDAALSDAEPQP